MLLVNKNHLFNNLTLKIRDIRFIFYNVDANYLNLWEIYETI